MATIRTAFDIATGALDADQEALNIETNNTANANTPGYTAEKAVWQQNDAVTLNGIRSGTGVQVTGTQSQRNLALEHALQQQTQAESASAGRLTALNQMQSLFNGAISAGISTNEANGIGSDLSNLFETLASLEVNPADIASRQNVLSIAGTLASDFNGTAAQLESQRASLDEQSATVVGQANSLLRSIAQLNVQIQETSPNADAGTLEDQRQQDLTQLSQLIGIRSVPTENNGLTVTTTNGALLVSEGQSYAITTGEENGVTACYDSQGQDITAALTAGGGQLGGILTARDEDIPQVESALDQLAFQVATQMNTMNANGADLNGNHPGAALFGLPSTATAANPAGSAAGISVLMTDPAGIAAAGVTAAGIANGPSDDSNLLLMADPSKYRLAGGTTPTEFFSDMVTSLGSLTSEVSSENTAQGAALTQLQNQIGALSGVNLNDEAASLETLEQAYQAASKLFTLLDQVMVSALNLGVETSYT